MTAKKINWENKKAFIIVNHWAGHISDYYSQILTHILESAAKAGLQVDMMPRNDLNDVFAKDHSWSPVEIQYQLSKGSDALIVIGGDGTKTHILNRMIQDDKKVQFIGIGTGTMNVGRTNTFRFGADVIDFSCLNEKFINAVKIDKGFDGVSYSFFDAIIGTTCVTNVDGVITQVSAKNMVDGIKIEIDPQFIGDSETIVEIQRANGEKYCVQTLSKIGTIAVSPMQECLKAQTLAGGADPCACLNFPGGVIVSDFPLVWANVSKEEVKRLPQITSCFSPLDFRDKVIIRNLTGDPYLISDGNSDGKLSINGTGCELSLVENAVAIVKTI